MPAPKAAARKASGTSQVAKAKPAPRKATAKKIVESDDDISMDDAPPPVPKRDAPRRAARSAPKTYIDISDDNDGGVSDPEFEDFD